jgi:hypothetical protein
MRLLTELLPPERQVPSRRGPYLRNRLHGTDIDAFALELARLSLTLTDIPNPDGWDLTTESLFHGSHLGDQAKRNTILLVNAPFEISPVANNEHAMRASSTNQQRCYGELCDNYPTAESSASSSRKAYCTATMLGSFANF